MISSYLLQVLTFICYFHVTSSFENHEILTPNSSEWERPFVFMILADPQIGWNKDKYNSEELFREASKHVQKLQPEFLIILGDLI